MDKQKQNGSAAKEKRANILLTLCIVLIGIMLFLMTDKGAAMLASLGISNTNADYYEYTVIGENEKVDPEIYAVYCAKQSIEHYAYFLAMRIIGFALFCKYILLNWT